MTNWRLRFWKYAFILILTINGLLLPFTVITLANQNFMEQTELLPVEQTRQWLQSLSETTLNWRNTTGWWDIATTDAPTPAPPLITAMLVEIRCHPALSVVLRQAAQFLGPEVDLVVYHSSKNQKFVQGLVDLDEHLSTMTKQGRLRLQIIHPETYGSVDPKHVTKGDYWYSRLMTETTFWNNITTPYAMVLQSNTLMCRTLEPAEFILQNVSFVGGLTGWKRIPQFAVPVTDNPIYNEPVKYRHKRGTFSLRNVEWTKECIRQYRNDDKYVEDSLYRHCGEMEIPHTVHVNELQAYSFASDLGVTLCFDGPNNERICPVGVHKPWVHGVKKAGYRELVDHCPGLDLFQRLTSRDMMVGSRCGAYDISGKETAFACDCTL